jgi:hypothetical protein
VDSAMAGTKVLIEQSQVDCSAGLAVSTYEAASAVFETWPSYWPSGP